MTQLTDREILEACARACGITLRWNYLGTQNANCVFDPLEFDGDCARMENRCGVLVDCEHGVTNEYTGPIWYQEIFTPGNDAERRRASCLVVARAQIEKEAGK